MLLLWALLAIFLFCSSLMCSCFGLSLLCSYYAFPHCAFAWSLLIVLLHSCYGCFSSCFCFGHSSQCSCFGHSSFCSYFGHFSLCSYFQVLCCALVLKLLLILWGGIVTSTRWNYYLTFQGKLSFFQFDQYFFLFFICVCCIFILLSFYHYGKSCPLEPHYPIIKVSK
jgi:hypothetical protein